MYHPTDRNLLVGILALQMDFISRDQLLAAMNAWILQKDKPLEQILRDNEALSGDTTALLQALVAKHLELHGNDVQRSLQSLSSIGELRQELQSLADPNIQATLSHIPMSQLARAADSSEETLDYHAAQIDVICDQFVQAWRGGQQPKIEEYLRGPTASINDELLAKLLREEIYLRRAAGDVVSLEDYLSRFPQHQEVIAWAFSTTKTNQLGFKVESRRKGGHGDSRSATRFRVIRPHAKGGLGEVFVARDTELNRDVALKEIQSRFADNSDSRSRFLLEAEVTGGLEHPGIVPVYGLGQYADGRPFYAMRFIQGDSLKEAIEQFHRQHAAAKNVTSGEVGVEFRKLLGRFIDVCEAIEYAHSRGVLHRDLKPGNIMLGKYGETLVVDWGLAKVVGRAEQHKVSGETTLSPDSGSGSARTQMGSAVGTPAFMSPEQAAGNLDEIGPTADVYSLGATLYYLLTGNAPIQAKNITEALRFVQAGTISPPRQIRRNIPAALDAICMKAMALKITERYASAASLAQEIEKWLADEPVQAHRETLPSRSARWLRKHRAWATSGIVTLLMLSTIATVSAIWIKSQNTVIMQQGNLTKRQLYVAQMNLAQNSWNAGRIAEAIRLLDHYRPEKQNATEQADLRGFEWHFWERLAKDHLLTWRPEEFNSGTFSQNGTHLATIGVDSNLAIWNPQTGTKLMKLQFDIGAHEEVHLSNLGSECAVVVRADDAGNSNDVKLFVYDVATQRELFRLSEAEIARLPQPRFFTCRNAAILAAWSSHGVLNVWDARSGTKLHSLMVDDRHVDAFALSQDGEWLTVASGTKIKLLSMGTGKEVRSWPISANASETTFVASDGKTTRIINVSVHDVLEFSPDSSRLTAKLHDGSVITWSINGEELYKLRGNEKSLTRISFSFDGQRIATAHDDQSIRIFDATDGHEITALKGHEGTVLDLAFSKDHLTLFSISADQTVKAWDAIQGQNPPRFEDERRFAFASDGKTIATSNVAGELTLWDTATKQRLFSIGGDQDGPLCLAYCSKTTLAASGNSGNTISVWDLARREFHRSLPGHSAPVRLVEFSQDGSLLLSVGYDGTIKIWHTRSWEERRSIGSFADGIGYFSAAFSPNAQEVTAVGDRGASVFDSSRISPATSCRELDGCSFVVFSADGKKVAAATNGISKSIKIFVNG